MVKGVISLKSNTKIIVCWIISCFLASGAWVYFPSVSSSFFILATIVSIPLKIVQTTLNSIGIKGWKKWLLVFLLFLIGCLAAPTLSSPSDDNPTSTISSESDDVEEIFDSDSSALDISDIIEEQSQEEAQEDLDDDAVLEETTSEETTSTANSDQGSDQQTETSQQTEVSTYTGQNNQNSQETVSEINEEEVTVYITETGSKYHRSSCRHLSKSKIETTLSRAKANGYEPCGTCNPPA